MNIGIIANAEKQDASEIVQRLLLETERRAWKVAVDAGTHSLCPQVDNVVSSIPELAETSDLLLVVGGDGTMLRVARYVAALPGETIPLLGIKAGRLGFLTQVTMAQIGAAFEKLENGFYSYENRTLLSAKGLNTAEPIDEIAVNDFVLSRGASSHIVELDVYIDNQFVSHYLCDGLILSTPTGSTAYSMAAGGGLVTPEAEVFLLTPICPHSFQNRSIIVNASANVRVEVCTSKVKTIFAVDGQRNCPLTAGDIITFCQSEKRIRLVRLDGVTFFDTLREKLHWLG